MKFIGYGQSAFVAECLTLASSAGQRVNAGDMNVSKAEGTIAAARLEAADAHENIAGERAGDAVAGPNVNLTAILYPPWPAR